MGHGCYYTHDETRTRAFWIELNYYYEDEETGKEVVDEWVWEDTIGNLKYELEAIGYTKDSMYFFSNGLVDLELIRGHGGEIVFKLEPKGRNQYYNEDIWTYNLAMANHAKCYAKIGRELKKIGYELRIASSGYTSTEY